MKGLKALMSQEDNEWNTPPEIFEALKAGIAISLDCASKEEHTSCEKFITPELDDVWTAEGETGLFLNPPYSPAAICTRLINKVIEQSKEYNVPAVILIPARTETKLWQGYIMPNCTILNKKGRIQFLPSYKVYACDIITREVFEVPPKKNSATFPSAFCFVNVKIEDIEKIADALGTPRTSIVRSISL